LRDGQNNNDKNNQQGRRHRLGAVVSSSKEAQTSEGRFVIPRSTTSTADTYPHQRYVFPSDLKLIHKWQERFRGILGRKPSIGEVAGILAHMAEARLDALGLDEFPGNLEELANYMIGKNKPD